MGAYQQVTDFTPEGAELFASFLAAEARPGLSLESCRMECLRVIEDNLNGGHDAPFSWELGALESATGKPATFSVELADLILKTATPAE